jgi:hypothetical protein
MPAVSQKIDNLIGGVSQQPDSLKLPGTLVTCDDYLPDPSFGLAKRPGAKHISLLSGALPGASRWGHIDRDDEEKYLVQIGRSGSAAMVKVWDAQSGEAQTVNSIASGAEFYLTHTNDDDLELLTVGDYSLILNRKVKVRQGYDSSPTDTPYAIVSINAIGYNSRYEFTLLPSTLYTFNSSATTTDRLSVRDVAGGLAAVINAGGILTATVVGPYLYVRRNDGGQFDAMTSGGQGGLAISIAKGKVSSPADLPRQFINNARMQVLSNDGSDGDDYWVTFKTDNGATSGVGVWEETIGPGVINGFDIDTLPHALIREANGSFTVRRLGLAEALATLPSVSTTGTVITVTVQSSTRGRYMVGQTFYVKGGTGKNLRLRVITVDASGNILTVQPSRAGQGFTFLDVVTNEFGDTFTIAAVATATTEVDPFAKLYWVDRQSGDIESNSWPSFKDNTIDGISFFKNRLVLSSQDNIITSVAGDYFNFFRTTAATVLASDPIDISAGSTKPLRFRRMLPYQQGLLCFSDNGQYSLETTTEAFSSTTAELTQVGSYDLHAQLAPVDIGPSIVFASQSARSTSIFEAKFTAEGNTRSLVSELTRSIPGYLPLSIQAMASSTSAGLLVLKGETSPTALPPTPPPTPTSEVVFGFNSAPVVGTSEVIVNDGPYVLGYHFTTEAARKLTRIGIYKPTQAGVNQPTTMDHSVGIWDWSNTYAPNFGAPTLIWQQDFPISGTCVAGANSTVAPYYCWFDIANGPELDPDVDYVVAATWNELSPVAVPLGTVNLIIQDFKLNETAATQQGAVPGMLIDLDSESYYAPTINTSPQKGFFTVNMELLRL